VIQHFAYLWDPRALQAQYNLADNSSNSKLENAAINDVLPLKAAQRATIDNLKWFWGLGHQRPNFDGYV